MVDIAFGPEPGKRPYLTDTRQAYLQMVRQKRIYSTALIVMLVVLMSAGFHLAQERNAGGFRDGLPKLGAFPSEVLSEAWADRANIPCLLYTSRCV